MVRQRFAKPFTAVQIRFWRRIMKNTDVICPVDRVVVDENKVRATAFFVLLLAIFFLLTRSGLIIAFLLADFALRIFNLNKYSPLAILGGWVIKLWAVKSKFVDRAPKRFAAIIGFIFLLAITFMLFAHVIWASLALTGILVLFASLEAFAGFCAGCYFYTLLKNAKLIA